MCTGLFLVKRRISTQDRHPSFLDDQRDFFDELITREWDTYKNSVWDATRKYEVCRLFDFVQPKRILDVGCGCGFHDRLMAERYFVEEVVGIDYSLKSIEAAEETYPHPKVRREVADILDMPQGAYDLVVSFQVIEHLRDALGFLVACGSQAREGGLVAVVTPNRMRFTNRVRALMGRPSRLGDPQHFKEFVPVELSELGRVAKLQYVNTFSYGLSINLPFLGRCIPAHIGLKLGYYLPSIADCFCIVFQKEDAA